MRRAIYEEICKQLLATGEIKHVDLWNQNVEFIEQEANWERPAVFVEFDPIVWDRTKEPHMRTRALVKLHIVTDWVGSAATDSPNKEDALEVFKYPGIVQGAIEGIQGETFDAFRLVESHTNHNHEDILESIEVYQYRGIVNL